MKLQELSFDERITIYGGSQASDAFMYGLGAICKGMYYLATFQSDYGMNCIARCYS